MRAVARNRTVHVVELTALPDGVYAVQKIVRRDEVSRYRYVRIYGMGLDLIRTQLRQARDLDLREDEPRETRMVRLVARAARRV